MACFATPRYLLDDDIHARFAEIRYFKFILQIHMLFSMQNVINPYIIFYSCPRTCIGGGGDFHPAVAPGHMTLHEGGRGRDTYATLVFNCAILAWAWMPSFKVLDVRENHMQHIRK